MPYPSYPTSLTDLKLAGQQCADYLARHVRGDGSFEYELYARTGRTTNKYNILRHAGAIYAFSQWMNWHRPGESTDQMEKPVAFLKAHALSVEEAGGLYCIVEEDKVKLGGVALALLALVEQYKSHSRKQDKIWMGRFGEFILWMQDPDGRFHSKFFYAEKKFSEFESTYYPGEAILSLLRLYRQDPDPRWLQAATAGAEYLLKHPVLDQTGARGHNHWFVIALPELLELVPRPDLCTEFWLIIDATVHAARQQIARAASSASVATYGEAVVAALLFELKQDRRERAGELSALAKDIVHYCLSLQVQEAGHFHKNAMGGIMESPGNDRIRIDFVQHTLQVISGLLDAQNFQ